MARNTGFFNAGSMALVGKKQENLSYVAMGGKQLHAIAVCLIDHFKNSSRINEGLLKTVLERLFQHFPQYKSNQPYLTQAERMRMILTNFRKSEVVESMAFVLKQLLVDELFANPLVYPEVFSHVVPGTTKDSFRQTSNSFPISALSALAKKLGITITVSFKEAEKELRLRQIYNSGSQTIPSASISLMVESGHYHPQVKNPQDFAYVGHLAINHPEPLETHEPGTLDNILDMIGTNEKHIVHTYHQWRDNLLSEVASGVLTANKLIDLYIQNVPATLPPNASYYINLYKSESTAVKADPIVDSHQYLINSIVSALASQISLGQIDPDKLFEEIEKKQPRHVLSAR
ncbi:MAG TPA: hypothetical protein PK657_07225 [Legionella sp.]|nr:hypothetical protein [Legionella sp.]